MIGALTCKAAILVFRVPSGYTSGFKAGGIEKIFFSRPSKPSPAPYVDLHDIHPRLLPETQGQGTMNSLQPALNEYF